MRAREVFLDFKPLLDDYLQKRITKQTMHMVFKLHYNEFRVAKHLIVHYLYKIIIPDENAKRPYKKRTNWEGFYIEIDGKRLHKTSVKFYYKLKECIINDTFFWGKYKELFLINVVRNNEKKNRCFNKAKEYFNEVTKINNDEYVI